MAKHIVIGTAGHVDHGKTTLVKALTGIETDTTQEEKKRGLTINLGFAYLDLPDGQRVGIVDVPGHERFIKNMVAGLPGINMILLVIDANEGVMPQTREHLDILTLLGVTHFLIVITKIDTVDEDMRELVREDIREQLMDTPAAHAPIVETDAISGKGIAELIQQIQLMTEAIPEADDHGAGRLNIDRVFTVKGFGTVVTGTLLDGAMAAGQDVYLYPGNTKIRVRNIQVHEKNVSKAEPSQRTALNLANIPADALKRGDVLCVSPELDATRMIDVKIQCLRHSQSGVGLWDRLRLLVGTTEVMVRAVPLGTDAIRPGEEGFLQLRLEEEQVVVRKGDRFILRTFSPMYTIAGGDVLDAHPQKHRRFKEAVLESLKAKDEGNTEAVVADFLRHAATVFATEEDICSYTHMGREEVCTALDMLLEQHVVLSVPVGYLHEEVYKEWRGKAVQLLLNYHQKYPLRQGMPVQEFRARLHKTLPEKYMNALLQLFADSRTCRIQKGIVAGSSFTVKYTAAQEKTKQTLLKAFEASGFTALRLEELTGQDKNAMPVLDAMNNESIIFVSSEYAVGKKYYDQAVVRVCQYVREHGKIGLGEFRDITESSRKSALLVLEYMDAQHITKRVENYRVLGDLAPQEQEDIYD